MLASTYVQIAARHADPRTTMRYPQDELVVHVITRVR